MPKRDKVLVGVEPMPSELFPPDFPSELRVAALEQATKSHGRGYSLLRQLSGLVRMDTRSLGRSFGF